MVLRMTDILVVYFFLAVFTANLKSSIGKSTQYNLTGSVFLKTSNT